MKLFDYAHAAPNAEVWTHKEEITATVRREEVRTQKGVRIVFTFGEGRISDKDSSGRGKCTDCRSN